MSKIDQLLREICSLTFATVLLLRFLSNETFFIVDEKVSAHTLSVGTPNLNWLVYFLMGRYVQSSYGSLTGMEKKNVTIVRKCFSLEIEVAV